MLFIWMLDDKWIMQLPPYSFAKKMYALVTDISETHVHVMCSKSTPPTALIELQRFYKSPIKIEIASENEVASALGKAYQTQSSNQLDSMDSLASGVDLSQLVEEIPKSEDLLDSAESAPVIRLINALFSEALRQEASDIHIETYENQMSVRFRIDGALQEILTPARALSSLLISRIKVMAKLDIAEKRVPQDGRVSLRLGGRTVDVRISTIPANYAERVVMRLLDQHSTQLDFVHLGMTPACQSRFEDLLTHPNGIILVTGPTGSGKTTTLYSGLTQLNDRSRNILTVEDPIEYELEGIGQTQVNNKVDMTFAKGLRAILRQDPDVVMIGEIRDQETAEVAVQASLTGHLVLSTLHTNDALGAITRLHDLGVPPFLISSSLIGVLAQRLVRVLCDDCKQPTALTSKEAEALRAPDRVGSQVYYPSGCNTCLNTGYKGRIGLYELLTINQNTRDLIHQEAGEMALHSQLQSEMTFMYQEGNRLILEGKTSVAEVLRTVREDQ